VAKAALKRKIYFPLTPLLKQSIMKLVIRASISETADLTNHYECKTSWRPWQCTNSERKHSRMKSLDSVKN